MAYHDVRLPEEIERGALGGPRYNTAVLPLDSGRENRNQNWQDTRGQWNIGYGLLKVVDTTDISVEDLQDFWYARAGRFNSFRFKDFSDFNIGSQLDPLGSREQIDTADGIETNFQVVKNYTSFVTHTRTITKLVTGTLFVYLDGVLQSSPGQYSANFNTGVIAFVSPPADGVVVAVTTEFDNHVRFDIDQLQINMAIFNAGSVPDISIVELLLEDET